MIPQWRFTCDFFARQSSGSFALNSISSFELPRLAAAEPVTPKWSALIHQLHPGVFGESANLHTILGRAGVPVKYQRLQHLCEMCLHSRASLLSPSCRLCLALIHTWKSSVTFFYFLCLLMFLFTRSRCLSLSTCPINI